MSAAAPNPLNEFEKKLKALEPLPGGLARDRLLFEAGRRSAKSLRVWPASSACLALVCVALSVRLLTLDAATNLTKRVAAAPIRTEATRPAVTHTRPLPIIPSLASDTRDPLSIGWLQQTMLKSGDPPRRVPSEVVAVGPVRPTHPPSVLNLEAEAMPAMIAIGKTWPAWLPFGGAR
jgi:hypothetical protein